MATDRGRFAELLDKQDFGMITDFKQTYIDALKQYYFVGGMPEAVQSFAENKDFNEVREIQKRILAAYEQDFSKHAPNAAVPRLRMLWNSIPSQLARENKKFVYGLVREGARAKEYETAMMWLCDCGLVYKVSRVNAAGLPPVSYTHLDVYKRQVSHRAQPVGEAEHDADAAFLVYLNMVHQLDQKVSRQTVDVLKPAERGQKRMLRVRAALRPFLF